MQTSLTTERAVAAGAKTLRRPGNARVFRATHVGRLTASDRATSTVVCGARNKSAPRGPARTPARGSDRLQPKAANVADPKAEDLTADQVIEEENKYLLQNYGARVPLVFTHGEGCYLYDANGDKYLDFAAGIAVNVLGHSDPTWTAAVQEQAMKLCHVSNLYHTTPHVELAKRLVENSFGDRVFFCNSGTEANEAAIKFARRHARAHTPEGAQPAHEIVAFTRSFHGRTMGALALTANNKYKDPFVPLMPGVHQAPYGDLEAAKALIQKGKTAAVFIEPVQGEGGIYPARAEFLAELKAVCEEAGAVLVFDEVQCGLGRTGSLWGHQQFAVTPHMMTLAKPLAGGLPVGAVVMTQGVADTIQPGDHGSTFAGGPLVMHAAVAVVDRVMEDGFLAGVAARGEELKAGLEAALAGHEHVQEVRGSGLMVGVQLDCPAGPVVGAARERGLLVLTAGAGDVIRLLPPLTVSSDEVAAAVETLKLAVEEAL